MTPRQRAAARAAIAGLSLTALAACGGNDPNESPEPESAATPSATVTAEGRPSARASTTAGWQPARLSGPEVLATGLEVPWGLAFLPDGTALISERDSGRILQLRPGSRPREVARLTESDARGEGGLLGIAVSPDYDTDRLVYAYYTTAEDNRIARFRLGERPRPILTGIPAAGFHNGGRIAFGPDGFLYAGTGDAGQQSLSQDPGSLGGKVLRMTADGRPAPGNPDGTLVWTLGHRNVQGLAWDDARRMYATEFGQNTFDEVNLLRAGSNYGWPRVEGKGGDQRFTDPVVTWGTAEASPSGAAIAGGNLYVAALRGERLWQVQLGNGGVRGTRPLLQGQFGRLRHVAYGPDGALWLLTSNRDGRGDPVAADDRVIRIPVPR